MNEFENNFLNINTAIVAFRYFVAQEKIEHKLELNEYKL